MSINGPQDQKPSNIPVQDQASGGSNAPREHLSEPQGSQAQTGGSRPRGARGTAAMDPTTRQEVARKGGLAVSRNKQHMAEIGRKGGQSVSKNREHMAQIGRKGGAASRGTRGPGEGSSGGEQQGGGQQGGAI